MTLDHSLSFRFITITFLNALFRAPGSHSDFGFYCEYLTDFAQVNTDPDIEA